MKKINILACCLFLLLFIGIFPNGAKSVTFKLFEDPLDGFPDNSVIDFSIHNNQVWCVTGSGISFTGDDGANWQFYDETNGLFSHGIASIYSSGSRIWLGLAVPEGYDGGNYLNYSDDDGFTWDTLLVDTAFHIKYWRIVCKF